MKREEALKRFPESIVRANLVSVKNYTPYCGSEKCKVMPRTKFNGKQFECPWCKWTSQFEPEFIQLYLDEQKNL